MISITAAANCDDVIVAWQAAAKIKGCLGFALQREVQGQPATFLPTYMPFEGQTAAPGESHPSTVWPIQRFVWTDHLTAVGVPIRYRVCPMEGTADAPTSAPDTEWSPWTDWVRCETQQTKGFSLFPNRGVVAAPWIERRLTDKMALPANAGKTEPVVLAESIAKPGDQLRDALAGPVLDALRAQFAAAEKNNETIYAALYELRDDELTELLVKAGDRVHVIVANGAFNDADPDPNAACVLALTDAGIDVTRRMVAKGHFAHNKFVVFSKGAKPKRVWTGSTNWTPTGLCTQSNHGLLIEDETISGGFYDYWKRILDAKSDYPKDFAQNNGVPAKATAAPMTIPPITTRAWFVPVLNYIDLDDARALIRGAEHGALFLMFRPGNDRTLVDEIRGLHTAGKFVRGVVNTNFLGSTNTPTTIQFFNKSAYARHQNPELILPGHLTSQVANERIEPGVQGVLIHSKTIVLDPFGAHPVVMTGSHNLGEKASRSNDDNLVIIENAGGLAREFAVYIMNVYDQYKWRYEKGVRAAAAKAAAATVAPGAAVPAPAPSQKPWAGLKTTDVWQNVDYLRSSAIETAFWFGG